MREKVLIVGSGFVARAVGHGLRAESDADILLTSTRAGAAPIDDLPVTTFEADVTRNSADRLDRVRSFAPDVAVLAFGKGIDPADTLRQVLLANAVYPLELVEWLRRETRCRSFVQVGTCFEYGPSATGRPLAETDTPQPFNPYGAGKLAACLALRAFSEASGCQVLHVRPFTLFGPGRPPRRSSATVSESAPRSCASTYRGNGRTSPRPSWAIPPWRASCSAGRAHGRCRTPSRTTGNAIARSGPNTLRRGAAQPDEP